MGWWELAGEWMTVAGFVPHGRLGAELESFLKDRNLDLRPISVRKAVAVRRFVEELQREGRIAGADRLAAFSLERVEAAKRVARYGEVPLTEFIVELLKGEKNFEQMEELERTIRAEAAASTPERANAHSFRLRGRSFRARALAALPALHPPPARWSPATPAITSLIEVTCDAVVLLSKGFLGFKVMAIPARGGDRDRMRDNMRLGLANSRMFDEYMFLCQRRTEADEVAAMFGSLRCGVGAYVVGAQGEIEPVLAPARDQPPDLAVRFFGVFGALFV